MADAHTAEGLLRWIVDTLEDMEEGFRHGEFPMVGREYPSNLSHLQFFFGRVGGQPTIPISAQTDAPDLHEINIVYQASGDPWDTLWLAAAHVDSIETVFLNEWEDAFQRMGWSLAPLEDAGWYELRLSCQFQYERIFNG